jgi:tetratricopeptide (TPR) repeat protein
MRYKEAKKTLPEIARELDVAAVVEGSVTRKGEKVQIKAQLIRADTDEHLWAESFESNIENIFGLHQQIAQFIAREIKGAITSREQPQLSSAKYINRDAYLAYLKGNFFLAKRTPESIEKARAFFEEAIEKEPHYPLAFSGLSNSFILLAGFAVVTAAEGYQQAKLAAIKALEMDKTLAEAHTSLALIKYRFEWDFPAAEKEFKRAIALNPAYPTAYHWYSEYLAASGRHQEAIEMAKYALNLDPLSMIANRNLARIYYWARDYDNAAKQCLVTLELDRNFVVAHTLLGRIYVEMGMYGDAIKAYRKAEQIAGSSPFLNQEFAYTYLASGNREEASKHLNALESNANNYKEAWIGNLYIHTLLGNFDRALFILNGAYKSRNDIVFPLLCSPRLVPLRILPGFKELMKKIGLEK